MLIFYITYKSLKINDYLYLAIILILIPISLINGKKYRKNISLYDLKFLEEQKEETILTYDSLQPLLYFEKKIKKFIL